MSAIRPAAAKSPIMSPRREGARRQGGTDRRGAADHGQVRQKSGGLPLDVFDGFRSALAANRAQFFYDVPAGPFYGFNRPGAKVSQGIIDNWWRQGMMGGAKAHYDCIKAFSETDFTEDLKKIDVPVLVLHGEDDQIVPIADSACCRPSWSSMARSRPIRLSARHVHDASRSDQSGPAGLLQGLTAGYRGGAAPPCLPSRHWLSRLHAQQELPHDFSQVARFVRQRMRRSQHPIRRGSRLCGGLGDSADIGRNFLCASCRLLDIAGDLRCRRRLLFDRGCYSCGDIVDLADPVTIAAIASTTSRVPFCTALI